MIEVLLFDLFGVVARPQSAEGRQRLVATAGGVPAPAFWTAYWEQRPPYDRGEVGGPQYWRRVADALGTIFDDRLEQLIDADIASWNKLDGDTLALLADLTGRRLAILSNIPEELATFHEKRLKQFDMLVFSCRIGHAKPDPKAFQWCLKALGSDPGRVLFIDDRAENVNTAKALGMKGHLFTSAAELRETLQPGVSMVDKP